MWRLCRQQLNPLVSVNQTILESSQLTSKMCDMCNDFASKSFELYFRHLQNDAKLFRRKQFVLRSHVSLRVKKAI